MINTEESNLMKVGILTFHRAYNYGAILQAFALQKKISDLGYESEIIDYLSNEDRKEQKTFHIQSGKGIKANIEKLIKDVYRIRKNRNFDSFMQSQMVISSVSYSTFSEMEKMDADSPYDCYIVGSDQVWNTNNNRRDKTFTLSFVNGNSRKCSYAASFGNVKLDNEMLDLYQRELGKFRVLTVREESSIEQYDFLKTYNAKVVLDPTLLLDSSNYLNIASPNLVKKKYAFMYTIAKERNLRTFAQSFCKEHGLLLIDSKKSLQFFQKSDPRDFLSFIEHAEYVFTNSFHGTAFSIIMNKQFATEVNTAKRLNNRSFDLLKKLGLIARDIDNSSFDLEKTIDYISVKEKLNSLRKESVDVLKEILLID